MDSSELDQLKQSINFITKFLENLRLEKGINLLNHYSYNDIANLHISVLKLNTFVSQQIEEDDIVQI